MPSITREPDGLPETGTLDECRSGHVISFKESPNRSTYVVFAIDVNDRRPQLVTAFIRPESEDQGLPELDIPAFSLRGHKVVTTIQDAPPVTVHSHRRIEP